MANPQRVVERASRKKVAHTGGVTDPPAVSLPIMLVMVTLVMVGLIGTLRMRKHALEVHPSALDAALAQTESILMTPEELAKYNGRQTSRNPIYIGILGQVFDVTPGKHHYGPDGSYSFFAGRDASRAYVTGKFQDDLNDDVQDLKPEDFSGLVDWRSFYQNHAKYKYVGKVVGRMYDAQGVSTPLLAMVEMKAAEYDEAQKILKERESSGLFPKTCSFKWHRDTGGRVSCDSGYPRRVYDKIKSRELCRCMPDTSVNETVLMYEGCATDATSCGTKKTSTGKKQREGDTSEL